jgi:hypothetical protein
LLCIQSKIARVRIKVGEFAVPTEVMIGIASPVSCLKILMAMLAPMLTCRVGGVADIRIFRMLGVIRKMVPQLK